MQVSQANKTTKLIKSITSMKNEELFQYKQKINNLEKLLEQDYSLINLYKYRQANKRFNNLKATLHNLKQLELSISEKKMIFSWDNFFMGCFNNKEADKSHSKNELF